MILHLTWQFKSPTRVRFYKPPHSWMLCHRSCNSYLISPFMLMQVNYGSFRRMERVQNDQETGVVHIYLSKSPSFVTSQFNSSSFNIAPPHLLVVRPICLWIYFLITRGSYFLNFLNIQADKHSPGATHVSSVTWEEVCTVWGLVFSSAKVWLYVFFERHVPE